MSIVVDNLTKIYGTEKAIDGVSFSINSGEIVGFLGPNGAGKSTTMKILTGFLSPNSGSAKVAGLEVSENPLITKGKIGYLPELNPLYPEMYVKEYLDFSAESYGLKNVKPRVKKVIETTGLLLEQNKKIGQLSKGYKQRVGLAQALLNNPEVLILDEPTSGLDPNQMTDIRKLIKQLGQDKTILLSSHIMQEVEAMCDRVIIINKGKIVADDLVENMKSEMSANHRITKVSFRDDIDKEKLESKKDIISLKELGPGTYELVTDESVDLAQILFDFAIQSNTIILEQREIEKSLESVFQQLTKNV